MKVALLGYAQAGKRTLFRLLTGRQVPASRKETESLEGCARVRDVRVDTLTAMVKPQKTRYAEVMYVLCPDVQMGVSDRPWLDEARRCELICLLVREFKSDAVYHPAGSVDAVRDRANLDAELVLADLELVEKRLERIGKEKRAGQTPEQALEERLLMACKAELEEGRRLAGLTMEPHEQKALRNLGLLTLKPVLWAYNVDEDRVQDAGLDPLTVSCRIEQEIMDLESPQERADYLATLGLKSSGVDRMNHAVYDALGLMSFYTQGEDEVRAWTIRKESTAPVAAGRIHSDMERGFIRAEVIRYDDFVAAGSESAVKAAGKVQLKGKDYVIQDGDICMFLFNV